MPLYDYACKTCGPFEDWRSMSEARLPRPCPACGQKSPRTIGAPFLARMNPHNRVAHQRNEKSAHEPKVIGKEQIGSTRVGHAGHGHGHGHQHPPKRPWMIGH